MKRLAEWLCVAVGLALVGGCLATLCKANVIAGRGFPRDGGVYTDEVWRITPVPVEWWDFEFTNSLGNYPGSVHEWCLTNSGTVLQVVGTNSFGSTNRNVYFDGANDELSGGDRDEYSFVAPGGAADLPFTIVYWVKETFGTTGGSGQISGKNLEYGVGVDTDETIFYLQDNALDRIGVRFQRPSTDDWHMIAVTYDGTKATNGMVCRTDLARMECVDYSTGTYDGMTNKTNRFVMGVYPIGGIYFMQGKLDNYLYYTQVLSQAQISTLYQKTNPKNELAWGPLWTDPKRRQVHYEGETSTVAVLDVSGNGWNATNRPAATNGPQRVNAFTNEYGRVSHAWYFDGVNDYLDAKNITTMNSVTNFTIVMNVYETSIGAILTDSLFGKEVSSSNMLGVINGMSGTNDWAFMVCSTPENSFAWTTDDCRLPLNTWYQMAFVFNGAGADNPAKVQVYKNGVQKALSWWGPFPTKTGSMVAPFRVGAKNLADYFTGMIGKVRVYAGNGAQYSLTSNEVWTLFQYTFTNDLERRTW